MTSQIRRKWDDSNQRNKLYGRRWRKARLLHLAVQPYCVMCSEKDASSIATVVDHIVPHRGDIELFWNKGNWQSLCGHHHNADKASMECKGYSDRIGEDGWPVDTHHPSNGGASNHQNEAARTSCGYKNVDLVSPPTNKTKFIF